MGLVNHAQGVAGKVVQQGGGRLSTLPVGDGAGIILDAGAVAHLGYHLQVVGGAGFQPLGLQQLALGLQHRHPFLQLTTDAVSGAF